MSHIKCPDHPESKLIEDRRADAIICSECGLILGDVDSEWAESSDSDDEPALFSITEPPPSSGNDLDTSIGAAAGSNQNRNHGNLMTTNNKILLRAYRDINDIADRINLPEVIVNEASRLFRKSHEHRYLRGRSIIAIVTACIYIACKKETAPRGFKELSNISGVSAKDIAKCYKIICKNPQLRGKSSHSGPGEFMLRFCSELKLSNEVQKIANDIVQNAKAFSIMDGKNPISIAAAAIYMASQISGQPKSQKEISENTSCAIATIRQSYKLMLSRASDLISRDCEFYSLIDKLPLN